jgi:hypothetical protein
VEIYADSFFRWSMTIANKVKIRYPRKKPLIRYVCTCICDLMVRRTNLWTSFTGTWIANKTYHFILETVFDCSFNSLKKFPYHRKKLFFHEAYFVFPICYKNISVSIVLCIQKIQIVKIHVQTYRISGFFRVWLGCYFIT